MDPRQERQLSSPGSSSASRHHIQQAQQSERADTLRAELGCLSGHSGPRPRVQPCCVLRYVHTPLPRKDTAS